MAGTAEVLGLTEGMAEHEISAGQPVLTDEHGLLVLVSGRLRVDLAGTELARIEVPGSFVGEIGALLGTARSADVVAVEDSVLRSIGDPDACFAAHPELGVELARQLAGRLHRLLAYLGDVRTQYADRDDQFGMLDQVIGRLSSRPAVDIEPGSDRAPDY